PAPQLSNPIAELIRNEAAILSQTRPDFIQNLGSQLVWHGGKGNARNNRIRTGQPMTPQGFANVRRTTLMHDQARVGFVLQQVSELRIELDGQQTSLLGQRVQNGTGRSTRARPQLHHALCTSNSRHIYNTLFQKTRAWNNRANRLGAPQETKKECQALAWPLLYLPKSRFISHHHQIPSIYRQRSPLEDPSDHATLRHSPILCFPADHQTVGKIDYAVLATQLVTLS